MRDIKALNENEREELVAQYKLAMKSKDTDVLDNKGEMEALYDMMCELLKLPDYSEGYDGGSFYVDEYNEALAKVKELSEYNVVKDFASGNDVNNDVLFNMWV